jgi:hypothetical protein
MAVDRVSSGKRQRRMIFFAQRRKGAKKVGLISRLRAKINAGKWRIPANAMPNPRSSDLGFRFDRRDG